MLAQLEQRAPGPPRVQPRRNRPPIPARDPAGPCPVVARYRRTEEGSGYDAERLAGGRAPPGIRPSQIGIAWHESRRSLSRRCAGTERSNIKGRGSGRVVEATTRRRGSRCTMTSRSRKTVSWWSRGWILGAMVIALCLLPSPASAPPTTINPGLIQPATNVSGTWVIRVDAKTNVQDCPEVEVNVWTSLGHEACGPGRGSMVIAAEGTLRRPNSPGHEPALMDIADKRLGIAGIYGNSRSGVILG